MWGKKNLAKKIMKKKLVPKKIQTKQKLGQNNFQGKKKSGKKIKVKKIEGKNKEKLNLQKKCGKNIHKKKCHEKFFWAHRNRRIDGFNHCYSALFHLKQALKIRKKERQGHNIIFYSSMNLMTTSFQSTAFND